MLTINPQDIVMTTQDHENEYGYKFKYGDFFTVHRIKTIQTMVKSMSIIDLTTQDNAIVSVDSDCFDQYFQLAARAGNYTFEKGDILTCIKDLLSTGSTENDKHINIASREIVTIQFINDEIVYLLKSDGWTVMTPVENLQTHFINQRAAHEAFVENVGNRLFMKQQFKEQGISDDYITQALVFLGKSSQQLSLATTVLANDSYVSDAMKLMLKDIQQQVHQYCDLLRAVPKVGERE